MSRGPLKVSFPGSQGHELAARLDMPAGVPRAFALFAHCFTCSKDIFAASRIARSLSEQGFAVLRFDFTGLGASEGEFANTNFSSNVEDLVKAADYLREEHSAPALLIGHSLGGAAVLAAAGRIAEARAVATIGAPADAEHVIRNFSADISEIEKTGEASVTLGGRAFMLRKQFFDDVRETTLREEIADMRKALLVMHAPRDEIVGIENATKIFTSAKHPKSFVSLDTADHLLSNKADAAYAADMIGVWATRFLPEEQSASIPAEEVDGGITVTETGESKFQQRIVSGRHVLFSDEPPEQGGMDTGPSPYDFLSIALGACTAMTLRLYSEHKGIPMGRVSVQVSHDKVHAEDCAECENRNGRVDRFERKIALTGDLSANERAKLLEIADKCPVHRTLEQSSVITTRLAD